MNLIKFIKDIIKKNKFLYQLFKNMNFIFKNLFHIKKNLNFFTNQKNENDENIYLIDNRFSTFRWDSFTGLVRASNYFYKKNWSLIIYDNENYRYHKKIISKEIYNNNLINILFQSILILPNPPQTIKIINNGFEIIKIKKKTKKIFPKNSDLFQFTEKKKWYLVGDFKDQDFQDFQINQPILKSSEFHRKIFKNFLTNRNIENYVTITIRDKEWEKKEWNTTISDINQYLDYINNNNLRNNHILIIPDTEKEIPHDVIEQIKDQKLNFHIFNHGSFSIPMRFLAYSEANFNFISTNGPIMMLLFLSNNLFYIHKDYINYENIYIFIEKFNKLIFKSRKVIHKKNFGE